MKAILLLMAALLIGAADIGAEILTQWSFNDTNAPAGAPPPAVGAGTATLLGGVTGAYVTGASADDAAPNKAWNTAKYP
jgi:hypothetical protein